MPARGTEGPRPVPVWPSNFRCHRLTAGLALSRVGQWQCTSAPIYFATLPSIRRSAGHSFAPYEPGESIWDGWLAPSLEATVVYIELLSLALQIESRVGFAQGGAARADIIEVCYPLSLLERSRGEISPPRWGRGLPLSSPPAPAAGSPASPPWVTCAVPPQTNVSHPLCILDVRGAAAAGLAPSPRLGLRCFVSSVIANHCN